MAQDAPDLLADMAAAGHEIALHGWYHRPLLLRGPRATYDDLARARDTGAASPAARPASSARRTG